MSEIWYNSSVYCIFMGGAISHCVVSQWGEINAPWETSAVGLLLQNVCIAVRRAHHIIYVQFCDSSGGFMGQ